MKEEAWTLTNMFLFLTKLNQVMPLNPNPGYLNDRVKIEFFVYI